MAREHYIYGVYVIVFIILSGLIIATPLLSFSQDTTVLYKAFAPTCHQKISRSLCILSDGKGYWMGDCTPQGSGFVNNLADSRTVMVQYKDGTTTITGYKMPVCARDFGIYGAMLLAALIYPLIRDIKEDKVWPAVWLIAAMVPIALDGGIQLVSEMGLLPFIYESTNAMRLFTGAIAGFAASLYAIPILMNMFRAGPIMKKKETKSAEDSSAGGKRAEKKESDPTA